MSRAEELKDEIARLQNELMQYEQEPGSGVEVLFGEVSDTWWTSERSEAVTLLAMGHNIKEVADRVGVTDRTIYNWKNEPKFEMEVDRCSLMYGVASRAARLRLLNKMIRKKLDDDGDPLSVQESLLDLLKEARMQTDGFKLDFSDIFTALDEQTRSLARSRPDRTPELPQPEEPATEQRMAPSA